MSRALATLAVITLTLAMFPVVDEVQGADPPPDALVFQGALVGGGFGLHVAKYTTWRGAHPVEVDPTIERLTIDGVAGVEGSLVDWWITVRGPDGEAVARTAGGAGTKRIVLDDATFDGAGRGTYAIEPECGLCDAVIYTITATLEHRSRGAAVSTDGHLRVGPGVPYEVAATVLNTGAAAETVRLEADAIPAGWTFTAGPEVVLSPGRSADTTYHLIAPAGSEPAYATFELLALGADGTVLATTTVTAAADPRIDVLRGRSHVVIALIDTGINPYHEEFRGTDAPDVHPAFYIDGYADSAEVLPLTLDAPDYGTAKALDGATWGAARGNTLYYVPGTRLIGTMCFGPCVNLDEGGHGTGTASLAAGTTLGEAPDALIVSLTGDIFAAMRWAARQPWIDVISMSLGLWAGTPTVGAPGPVGAGTGNPYVPFSPPGAQRLAFESGKRWFTGSAQGFGAWTQDPNVPPAGVSGPCPYPWASSFAGTPWTFTVETYWPWTELPWRSSCAPPDVVAKGWDLVAASPRSLAGTNGFGHSSGATPQAAGAYARLIHDARARLYSTFEGPLLTPGPVRNLLGDGIIAASPLDGGYPSMGPLSDGVLTVDEAETAFLHGLEQVDTAESFARHGEDPRWASDATLVVPGGEYALEGFGILNDGARAAMRSVVLGEAPGPLRVQDDALYAGYWGTRFAFWEPHAEFEVWVF